MEINAEKEAIALKAVIFTDMGYQNISWAKKCPTYMLGQKRYQDIMYYVIIKVLNKLYK